MPDYYYEFRRQQAAAIEVSATAFGELASEFAHLSGRVTARSRSRLEGATTAIVALGSTAGTVKDVVDELREEGASVGLLKLTSFRPFPAAAIAAALSGVDSSSSSTGPTPRRDAAAARGGRRRALRQRLRAQRRRLRPRRARPAPHRHPRRLRRRRPPTSACEVTRVASEDTRAEPEGRPAAARHSLCQGCGVPMVVRTVLSTIRQPVVVVNATGCLEVATTRYPTTAWNVPWLHVAFENAAAVASGVESAQRACAGATRFPPRGRRGRRLRGRRRHLRHRPAGALRRPRAGPSLPLRLLRQRGLHEHRRAAIGRPRSPRARRRVPPAARAGEGSSART